MSRSVSTAFQREIQARDGGDPVLVLLTISHPMLGQPIRVTSDSVPTSSGGATFQPYAFDVKLPDEKIGALPEASLVIDNVDRVILEAARQIRDEPPGIVVQVVLASDPDKVEVEFDELELVGLEYDARQIRGRVAQSPILDAPFPSDRFTPQIFPALFK